MPNTAPSALAGPVRIRQSRASDAYESPSWRSQYRRPPGGSDHGGLRLFTRDWCTTETKALVTGCMAVLPRQPNLSRRDPTTRPLARNAIADQAGDTV